jgi:hypothetical protein
VAARTHSLDQVLASAAKLQTLIPEAVLVGGTAAAVYAGHRESVDHDHVLADLADKFDLVLDALEREGEWITNRVIPGKIILGSLGEIEAGVRQLIRQTPLEVTQVELSGGEKITIPTLPEIIRIKAFLITKRNQLRDYLDLAALAQEYGTAETAAVLRNIDTYYTDPQQERELPLATQLATQLADPKPQDKETVGELKNYKGLTAAWQEWTHIVSACQKIARSMLEKTC